MDYTARFGLEFNPFIKNSKDMFITTHESKEITLRLNYLVNIKGFGLLTGSPGKGKTTAVRNFMSSLNQSLYTVIYICLSTITTNEFYKQLASKLGAIPAFRKIDNFKLIQNEINRLSFEKHKTPIIILDEADSINYHTLNDLKIIFNFDMDSKDNAVLLLVGLPKLNNTLGLSIHEPLKQRIIMNYNLEGLSKDEARNYILEKIKQAGCKQDIFNEQAIEAIINSADGTMRIINKICNSCLLIGHSLKTDIITSEVVMKAINDSELG